MNQQEITKYFEDFFNQPVSEEIQEFVDIESQLYQLHDDTIRELQECRVTIPGFKIGNIHPKPYNKLIELSNEPLII